MKKILIRTLLAGPALIGPVAITNVAPAQNPITLIEYTNVWSYFTNGTDLGTAWRARTYNDAVWPSGRGLLGYETTPVVYSRAPFNTMFVPYNPSIITYYFRAHFNFPTNPCEATLVASNYIDDGAVIYLNGTEMARFRVPDNLAYLTVTGVGPATEGQSDVATFTPPPGTLVQGDNVIAVEVHQISAASADIVWGMNLTATVKPVAPVSIVSQPQDLVAVVGEGATFCVGASSRPSGPGACADISDPTVSYQWQRANAAGLWINLPGAANACYTISPVATNQAGRYRVIAGNCANSVTSRVATLTVSADVAPPRLLSAIASDTAAMPTIPVTFSEALRTNEVFNMTNYTITSGPGGSSLIISNVGFNGTNVVQLLTSPWNTATNYVLVVNHLRDRSSNANVIAANSAIGVALWRDLLPMDAFWSYRQVVGTPVNWTCPNYVESPWEWFSGQAPFSYEIFPRSPLPFNAQLDFGYITYYFRTRFVIESSAGARGVIKFNHLVDDGAVFHLNGREVFRYNMPPGPVTYETYAREPVDATAILSSGGLAVSNLLAGANLLCVEVHQAQGDMVDENQLDAVFATSLRAAAAPDLKLTITPNRLTNRIHSATLRWQLPGALLQSAADVTGPWVDVAGGASGYTASVSAARRFYRLKLF